MYSKVRKEKVLTTSPASPEVSGIGRRLSMKDVTTYQNYEAGVAYVPRGELCQLETNLSRFNVSPPRAGALSTGGNNNWGRHAGTGGIYGSQSRAQKKLSLPKKVSASTILSLDHLIKISFITKFRFQFVYRRQKIRYLHDAVSG